MKRNNGQEFSSRGICSSCAAAGRLICYLGVTAIALASSSLHGQINPSGPSVFSSGPIGSVNHTTPLDRARRKVLAAQRVRDQQEMEADVAKLLALANELNKEEQTAGSNPQEIVEKARQIEKLAHRVQTLMREAGDV